MKIIRKPISDINIATYNPRVTLKPGDPAYEKIKKSIQEFELVEPLVWNERSGNLVGGHQRLQVLLNLGYTEVEVSVVNIDEEHEKALNLSLNKITGEWDTNKLQFLLGEFTTNIEITGFDSIEVENIRKESISSDIKDLLTDLDLDNAIEKPLWVIIRTDARNQSELNGIVQLSKNNGFHVETNYDG